MSFQKVIEVSKKYLPYMSSGFDSDKLEQHIGDGFAFMKKHKKQFDVIITDSSDPEGRCGGISDGGLEIWFCLETSFCWSRS